jgi:hypothetical protein
MYNLLGWVWQRKLSCGSMCEVCALAYWTQQRETKNVKHDESVKQCREFRTSSILLDPGTGKPMLACPHCEHFINAFNLALQYCNCLLAPKKNAWRSCGCETIREHKENQVSRQAWTKYVLDRDRDPLRYQDHIDNVARLTEVLCTR